MTSRRAAAAALIALPIWPLAAAAQNVALAGQMGRKALLVIDGQTTMLAVGEQRAGVKLLALEPGRAEIDIGGRISVLQTGSAPVRLSAGGADGGREVVLTAGPGGHFRAGGGINGRPVQFLVDTGATVVALGQSDAERIGLDFRAGQRVRLHTANGDVIAHQVTLSAVTLGDVTLANVAAVVLPAPMSHVLLGNSFLSRFQMRRDNDVMRLELR